MKFIKADIHFQSPPDTWKYLFIFRAKNFRCLKRNFRYRSNGNINWQVWQRYTAASEPTWTYISGENTYEHPVFHILGENGHLSTRLNSMEKIRANIFGRQDGQTLP